MPRSALVLPALASLTVAAVLASGAPADAAAARHGRSAVAFHTTANRRVAAPATTRPGIAHLRNTGSGAVFIAEAKHGTSSATALAKSLKANTPASFLDQFRLVSLAPARSGSYTELTRGTYYLADLDGAHVKANRISTMTVTGPRVDARTPKGRGLLITSHRQLRLPGTIARSGYLHVQNHSSAFADFLFVGVDNATTRAMLAKVVAHPSLEKVFSLAKMDSNPFAFAPVPAAGPHSVSWVHYHGKPGRYLATVLAVGKSGHGHLHHGQVRVLTLK